LLFSGICEEVPMIRLPLTPEQQDQIRPMLTELVVVFGQADFIGWGDDPDWKPGYIGLTLERVDHETARKIRALLKKPSPASAFPPRQGPDDVQAVPPRNRLSEP
jgi:hypothetical protein